MVNEFKIQRLSGDMWIDIGKVSYDYFRIKGGVHNLRLANPNHKYRIIGRECHPWCEIKEGEK